MSATKTSVSKPLEVVVLVLQNQHQQVLLARRSAKQHQGNLWEFPGGKVESGETLLQALQREIQEELQYAVRSPIPLIQLTYAYPDLTVRLHVFMENAQDPQVAPAEQQPLRWVDRSTLPSQQLPAANQAIVQAILLPRLLPQYRLDAAQIPAASDLSQPALLRIEHLPQQQQQQLLEQLSDQPAADQFSVCSTLDCGLFPQLNWHLPHPDLLTNTSVSGRTGSLSADCHSVEQVKRAQKQCDWIIFSPTAAGEPDWEHYAQAVSQAGIPVYAQTLQHTDQANDLMKVHACFGQGIVLPKHLSG